MLAILLFLLALLTPAPRWPAPQARDITGPLCVAAALWGWEASAPGAVPGWDLPSVPWIYARAQARDGLPLPHDGTFVRAGWDALAAAGYVVPGSARFTQDRRAAAGWLTAGPVVAETDWYPSMGGTDGRGFVTFLPTPEHWRHAYECVGIRPDGAWACLNDLGPAWGDHGLFYLHPTDLDALLRANGWLSQARKVPAGPRE